MIIESTSGSTSASTSSSRTDPDIRREFEEGVQHVSPLNAMPLEVEENTEGDIPDLQSTVTSKELKELKKLYCIPDFFEFVLHGASDRIFNPPRDTYA